MQIFLRAAGLELQKRKLQSLYPHSVMASKCVRYFLVLLCKLDIAKVIELLCLPKRHFNITFNSII